MSVRVVNLTAHEVSVRSESGDVLATYPPAGVVARLCEVVETIDDLMSDRGRVPLRSVSYADTVVGLPAPMTGTAYVVSRVFAAAIRRDDLLFPGGEVRDEDGNIIGCRFLGRFVGGPADA